MPVYDTISLLGGYNVQITDWALGDDRQFFADITTGPYPPPTGDLSLSDAYFTLKQSPTDTDANAILQLHITQSATVDGQITSNGSEFSELLFKIASESYQPYVSVATPYYWDCRCITQAGGVTFTTAIGGVTYLQNVTQADKAGTPASLPGNGQPQFRGFTSQSPQQNPANVTVFNTGDWYMNSNPGTTGPAGWVCYSGGTPGGWFAFGSGASTGWVPNPSWFDGTTIPIAGTYKQGQIIWNTTAAPGDPVGWYCTTGGTPGIWKPFGLISL